MTKELEYCIPVELKTTNRLIVKAISQSEAIKKIRNIVSKNTGINNVFEEYKILESEIECLQEDSILDELIKDNELYNDNYSGSDYVCMLNGDICDQLCSVNISPDSKLIKFNVVLSKDDNTLNNDNKFMKIKDGSFIEVFLNNECKTFYKKFNGLDYIGVESNKSIDSACLTNTYVFKYISEEPLSEVKELDVLIKQEKENFKTRGNNA